jgi:hypothetical protein
VRDIKKRKTPRNWGFLFVPASFLFEANLCHTAGLHRDYLLMVAPVQRQVKRTSGPADESRREYFFRKCPYALEYDRSSDPETSWLDQKSTKQ